MHTKQTRIDLFLGNLLGRDTHLAMLRNQILDTAKPRMADSSANFAPNPQKVIGLLLDLRIVHSDDFYSGKRSEETR